MAGLPQVLRWYAYWQEVVPGSPLEAWRVRRCSLHFFLEDGTLEVREGEDVVIVILIGITKESISLVAQRARMITLIRIHRRWWSRAWTTAAWIRERFCIARGRRGLVAALTRVKVPTRSIGACTCSFHD